MRYLLGVALAFLGLQSAADDSLRRLTLTVEDPYSKHVLSVDFLESFDRISFKTQTDWEDAPILFEGPPLKAVLAPFTSAQDVLKLTARDGYQVEIPVSELDDDYPILAIYQNNTLLDLDLRGPYWIVYPYDSDPKFKQDVYAARSIWQLVEITIAGDG